MLAHSLPSQIPPRLKRRSPQVQASTASSKDRLSAPRPFVCWRPLEPVEETVRQPAARDHSHFGPTGNQPKFALRSPIARPPATSLVHTSVPPAFAKTTTRHRSTISLPMQSPSIVNSSRRIWRNEASLTILRLRNRSTEVAVGILFHQPLVFVFQHGARAVTVEPGFGIDIVEQVGVPEGSA